MEPVPAHTSWKAAGRELVAEALDPTNWVGVSPGEALSARPVNLCRRVGHTRVVASVDVSERLGLLLHVAFRGPSLDPMGAAALLAAFLDGSRPLLLSSRWQVEVDARGWVHFVRPYLSMLRA
jgi:hypothetical protein